MFLRGHGFDLEISFKMVLNIDFNRINNISEDLCWVKMAWVAIWIPAENRLLQFCSRLLKTAALLQLRRFVIGECVYE